ncbi:GNAT family N-acetyltransferase [Alloiococcus sp. CFN-8]|uniref:GNAT family N-acetyltransferase n=1 Tax=Alloiococcus sp. CFN-8 TaxID=3416081 RepID=UPI003CF93033
MPEEIHVSKLNREDVEGAFEVFKRTIPFAFEREGLKHLTEEINNEIIHKKSLMNDALNTKGIGILFLTAEIEGKIIGTISYGPVGEDIRNCTNGELDEVGELGSVFVLPEHQGKGIATKLINTLISELNKKGIEKFCLDSGYGTAQKIWTRKFGAPYKRVKDYWGPGTVHMVWLCSTKSF